MIVQYILGGFFILLSLILTGIGVYVICKGERNGFISILLSIIFISLGMLIIANEGVPTKHDVLDGKAYYQENIHIRDNDTIKTYEIVWKQKN